MKLKRGLWYDQARVIHRSGLIPANRLTILQTRPLRTHFCLNFLWTF